MIYIVETAPYNERVDKGRHMAATQERNNRRAVEDMVAHLEKAPRHKGLADFGVTFSKRPIRDIGAMAWLLDMKRDQERTDRFLVVEEADVCMPGCGTNSQTSASVSRLIVDLRHGVMRMAREHIFPYRKSIGLLYGAEDLTAYNFLETCARTPQLMSIGLGSEPDRQIQTIVEGRLYQVSDGMLGPCETTPTPIESETFAGNPGMERMIRLVPLILHHANWVASPVE